MMTVVRQQAAYNTWSGCVLNSNWYERGIAANGFGISGARIDRVDIRIAV